MRFRWAALDLALGAGTEIDEPQPDRRLYAPQRLRHGQGRVQGFPLGSALRPGRLRATWATRPRTWPSNMASPASASTASPSAVSSAPSRRATAGILADEIVAVVTRPSRSTGSTTARHQAAAQGHRARRYRQPYPPLALRGAGQAAPGLRRRADRRQFVGHRRWRRRRARRLVGLCASQRPQAAGAHPRQRCRSACRPRSWASARRPPSAPCSKPPA